MKSYAPILGFLSLLWLGLGSWWLSNMTCGASDAAVFSVTDGKFLTQSDGTYTFNQSSSTLGNYKTVKSSFTKVAKHLKDNPTKMLALTGVFGNNETNKTDFETLGVARAESIKAKLVDLGAEPDRITTTGQKVDNLTFTKKVMEGGVNFLFNSTDAAPTSDAGTSDASEDAGTVTFSASSPMNLNITSADFDLSGNTDFQNYIKGLGEYMANNPDAQILISSFNNDRTTRSSIRRTMRSYLKKELGLPTARFAKLEGKAGDSETGEAMVSVGIK